MTKEQAIALADSKFWESMTFRERARFQLFTDRLCMPFDVFHEAVQKSLGRPVFTHEFGMNPEELQQEFLRNKPAPTMDEILALIPEDKRIIVIADK